MRNSFCLLKFVLVIVDGVRSLSCIHVLALVSVFVYGIDCILYRLFLSVFCICICIFTVFFYLSFVFVFVSSFSICLLFLYLFLSNSAVFCIAFCIVFCICTCICMVPAVLALTSFFFFVVCLWRCLTLVVSLSYLLH